MVEKIRRPIFTLDAPETRETKDLFDHLLNPFAAGQKQQSPRHREVGVGCLSRTFI
jgi:hypothetical protein